jgi:hypothetical protein
MRAAGWIFEGNGNTGAFACVPQGPSLTKAEGLWFGSTNTGSTIIGIVLDDQTFYFLYTAPGANYIGGVVQGNATGGAGQFASSNARDFDITGYGVFSAPIAGNYITRAALNGTINSPYGSATFSATYQSAYEQPASLAQAAGSYRLCSILSWSAKHRCNNKS